MLTQCRVILHRYYPRKILITRELSQKARFFFSFRWQTDFSVDSSRRKFSLCSLRMKRMQHACECACAYFVVKYASRTCAHLKDSLFIRSLRDETTGFTGKAVFIFSLLRYPTRARAVQHVPFEHVFSRFLITVNLAGPLMLLALTLARRCNLCAM